MAASGRMQYDYKLTNALLICILVPYFYLLIMTTHNDSTCTYASKTSTSISSVGLKSRDYKKHFNSYILTYAVYSLHPPLVDTVLYNIHR